MSAIFLKVHLGLGDAILMNGLVRSYAKYHAKVLVPAKFHNAEAVKWMFSDLPNVEVVSVKDDRDMVRQASGFKSVGVGLFSKRGLQSNDWDKAMYEDVGLQFDCRWIEFKLPITTNAFLGSHRAFIHNDPKRGYLTNRMPLPMGYSPDPRIPFENHILPLATAEEIHVIDSCFLCLADSIPTNAKRHVLHLYATAHDPYKKLGPPTLRKNWEILR